MLRTIRKVIDIHLLTVKYWMQGDEWKDAKNYAKFIVGGFK